MRYELIEHTADIMIKSYGRTLEECFGNAAYALFDQMTDASRIDLATAFTITAEGYDNESRLYAFLSELIFIHDTEHAVMNEFDVRFDGNNVICIAYGEPFDASKHTLRKEIKAITYHMMDIDVNEPSVTVIFDV